MPLEVTGSNFLGVLLPKALNTTSLPLMASVTDSKSKTSHFLTIRFGCLRLNFSGFLTAAVTTCPLSKPCFTALNHTPPDAPKITTFIFLSFLLYVAKV